MGFDSKRIRRYLGPSFKASPIRHKFYIFFLILFVLLLFYNAYLRLMNETHFPINKIFVKTKIGA